MGAVLVPLYAGGSEKKEITRQKEVVEHRGGTETLIDAFLLLSGSRKKPTCKGGRARRKERMSEGRTERAQAQSNMINT